MKKHPIPSFLLFLSCSLLFLLSCQTEKTVDPAEAAALQKENEKQFVATMQKHLDAVSHKDLNSLEQTLSPDGTMYLILPNEPIRNTVKEFVDFHREWFQDSLWTFETKILNTEIGSEMGIAITEIVYREPERNGKPYFNRMAVSYGLKKTGGNWYVIKDQACTLEKSEN